MIRITKEDYKDFHRDNQLRDSAIDIAISMASGNIDMLALADSSLNATVLRNAELLLALYFGTGEDRRKKQEGVVPSTTVYETISYLDMLRTLLGDAYLILFPPLLKRASIKIITLNNTGI